MFDVGSKLPDTVLRHLGPEGVVQTRLSDLTDNRKVVIFGVPGAFTSTCSMAHLPSFLRTRAGFAAAGVDEVICVAVNDIHVLKAWDDATGAGAAGITLLADTASEMAEEMDYHFTVPAAGFIKRFKRFALYAEDGVVKIWLPELTRGCETSTGEALLAAVKQLNG